MFALQTHNLKKYFGGVHAVDGLTLSIRKGTITSIVGPNGSGKSSCVNVLSGVYSIDAGTVTIDSVAFHKLNTYDVSTYGITRTFQEVRLFEQMTVLDNMLVVTTERNVFGALAEKHSDYHYRKSIDVLKRVGLEERKNALALNLSYGQRKLLEIARVLAMDKSLILFDEPFAGLFPQMVKIVVSIVKELREQGKTIVLIEHNMDLIRELSDEVIVIDEGRVLASGEPGAVLKRRDVIEAYLGE
ncbi:MAG: ATP-binding cassette domain-containing protein [Patescibacteria group bacterium]